MSTVWGPDKNGIPRQATDAYEQLPEGLGRPLKLEPGGVYAIECDRVLSQEALGKLQAQLRETEARLGVRFVLLDRNLRIARERGSDGAEHSQ